MKPEKNNIHYSAEYLRKYLDGELPDREMQALEKAALEDPFLADAIEGLEESRHHPVSFESGLADLEKRLALRIGENKRKTRVILLFSKWKIAASVLFILGITIFTYTYITSKNKAELATTTAKDSVSVPATEPAKVPADTAGIHANQLPGLNVESDTTTGSAETVSDESIASVREKKAEAFRKKELTASEKKKENPSPADLSGKSADKDSGSAGYAKSSINNEQPVPVSKSVASQSNEKSLGRRAMNDKTVSENLIKGVVVDNKGKPIPFAKVKFKGYGNGTFTDTSGLFKLYAKNPDITAELEFIHPGYEPATAELIPDSSFTNKVQLHEIESSMSEVVVTEEPEDQKTESPEAYYKNKKEDKAPTILGLEDFNNYIIKNKKTVSTDSLMKGEEIISFMLYDDGKITSFKIEKSISPAHDEGILRLIRMAPPLKLQNAKKQRYRVTVTFP